MSGVHNTGLSVARTLPAEAVEAIESSLACGSRKERRKRWEVSGLGSGKSVGKACEIQFGCSGYR